MISFGQIVVDYKAPLQNNSKDEGWGKIDLVSLILNSPKKELCFREVKINNKDSLKYAVKYFFSRLNKSF